MKISFHKYHALGLDYIAIDTRQAPQSLITTHLRTQWCERRFGVGAHGIVELCSTDDGRWTIRSYDAWGQPGEFCAMALAIGFCFARDLGVALSKATLLYQGMEIESALISEHENMRFVGLEIQPFFELGRIGFGFSVKAQKSHFLLAEEHITSIDIHAWSESMQMKHSLYQIDTMGLFEREGETCLLRSLRNNHATEDFANSLLALAATQLIGCSRKVFAQSRGGEMDVHYNNSIFKVQLMVNHVYEGQIG